MKRKTKGKSAKLIRKAHLANQVEQFKEAPHSFVFHRGKVGRNIQRLIQDVREVMEPYTASQLKVKKTNTMRDFVNIAGPLGVSHFLVFTKSTLGNYLKIIRMPHGPSLTFKFRYTLSKDVRATLRKPNIVRKIFLNHPLVVLNNFSGSEVHLKLMSTMFQNMFEPLNVNKLQLNNVRRVVLLSYNSDTQEVYFRHYTIRVVPLGLSRPVQKLLRNKVPNLGRYEDISQFVEAGGNLSESEVELDGEHNKVALPQRLEGRGNRKAQQSAIRVKEIGPRMTLELIKIEDGVNEGKVMYHKFVQKTPEEVAAIEKRRAQRRMLKARRKKAQEDNVQKKKEAREQHKQKSLEGMQRKKAAADKPVEPVSEDDDEEYYRQEVEEEPEPELFPKKRKAGPPRKSAPRKKQKRMKTKHGK